MKFRKDLMVNIIFHPRYKWGRLVNQNGVYHIKRSNVILAVNLANYRCWGRRKIIRSDFLYYIRYISDKLQKKKVEYDCNLLKSDLELILMKWEDS